MVTYYLDNRGNSRANTCIQTRLHGRVVFIRYRTNPACGFSVIHNNCRIAGFAGDEFIQVSALSASDGRVVAYRGFNG